MYSIPAGTSDELKDLLCSLLKRNPADRLEFRKSFDGCYLLECRVFETLGSGSDENPLEFCKSSWKNFPMDLRSFSECSVLNKCLW